MVRLRVVRTPEDSPAMTFFTNDQNYSRSNKPIIYRKVVMAGFLLYTVTFHFLIHLNKENSSPKMSFISLLHYFALKIFEFLNSKFSFAITHNGQRASAIALIGVHQWSA